MCYPGDEMPEFGHGEDKGSEHQKQKVNID
jgi:hypothetical protein